MSETRIETDVVYEHNQLGEVLVTGIGKMYDEWDVNGPSEDIDSGEVLVFYHDRFDGYGGMQPTPDTDNINEFAKQVTRDRAFDYDAVSELRLDEAMQNIHEQREERDYSELDPEDYTKDE